MRVAVVGCGYVGLVTGVGLASLGHAVTGIESDGGRRDTIASGRAPFFEPGLEDLLASALADGTFTVTGDIGAASESDVVLLAVQTPPTGDGGIDLEPLRSAATALHTALGEPPRRRVVAVRSTVVPGTVETVLAPLFDGSTTAVASNPEFLAEGSAVPDFLEADRVVVGCNTDWGRAMLVELYEPLGTEIVAVSPSTAELAKYTSNALLATLISFSNEIGRIAETLPGVDVEDVLGIIHRDRRLTPNVDGQTIRPGILSYLKAGCGYGGSCLPKDLSALLAHQKRRGHTHPLLDAVRAVNDDQPRRVIDMTASALGDTLEGRRVTVLGVAFKAGTDDLRSSPGLRIVDELLARGASVTIFDPLVGADALSQQREQGVEVVGSLLDAISGCDACILTTLAPEFAEVAELTGTTAPLVIDGRRLLPATDQNRVLAVGRGPRATGPG
ncbi:MAG: nucleotide sugar dehydrogenase [Acidimicrobiales bacterium]